VRGFTNAYSNGDGNAHSYGHANSDSSGYSDSNADAYSNCGEAFADAAAATNITAAASLAGKH